MLLFLRKAGFVFLFFIGCMGTGPWNAHADEPPKSIGQKPEDEEDIRRIFLRQSFVLLNRGELELEAGVSYLSKQLSATIYNAKFRQFQFPLSLRYGLLDRLEVFLSAPLIHAEQEYSFADDSVKETAAGIGDTTLGFNLELKKESARWPDMTMALSATAPTGEEPDEDGLSTGSGHWTISSSLQFIRTVDPVVLFWGIRYTYGFPATHYFNDGTYEVQPGDTLGYNMGFGFAVNDSISISAQVLGSYQWETETDGSKVPGTSGEPVSIRSALTYRLSSKTYIEPNLIIGLNDEAADFILGLAISHRFGK